MKINEAERLLGITKANIRFYEKEGLIAPGRTQGGYRDYSDEDILRLKQIIILRKLGIPVQQIADILDGGLPLREALDQNIRNLQDEIRKLSGSLALSRQLLEEEPEALDTERYWDILRQKEQQGYGFQSLVKDYIDFFGSTVLSPGYWIPEDSWHSPRGILKYTVFWSILMALLYALIGRSFLGTLTAGITGRILGILFWGLLLLPLYLWARQKPAVRDFLEKWLPVFWLVLAVIIIVVCMSLPFFQAQ